MTDKKPSKNKEQIFQKLRTIGKALARVNGNNTHSGNISMRDPLDPDLFHITAGGSQIGDLIPQDIVPIKFSGISWGDARGSSESTIHRSILKAEGINSVIHSHHLNTVYISFDTKEKQLFLDYLGADEQGRDKFIFHPVDVIGSHLIGGVKVSHFHQPVGSVEMEERIPQYLSENPLTIVRGHGPFARGSSPEDALYKLSVLENSATLLLHLRRKGVDVVKIQQFIRELGLSSLIPSSPSEYCAANPEESEINDQSIIDDFRQRLNFNYNNLIGAIGTGSMSQKISNEQMIYCPMSALPEGLEFPLYRRKLDFEDKDTLDLQLHKLIYQNTHQNTCMITSSPLATAEGMSLLADRHGEKVLIEEKNDIKYAPDDNPVMLPIDAEAIYLNPKVGLVDLFQLRKMTPDNPILNMLRWYKGCCIVAGFGVVSTGEATLEQAAHNASSAERIAQFRFSVFLNQQLLDGPNLDEFE